MPRLRSFHNSMNYWKQMISRSALCNRIAHYLKQYAILTGKSFIPNVIVKRVIKEITLRKNKAPSESLQIFFLKPSNEAADKK